MRSGLIGSLLLLAATGCASDALTLEYESTLWSETRGLVLHDDSSLGHAAMWDTTCAFDVRSGEITFDVDLPTEQERVQDVRGSRVLASTADGAFEVTGTTFEASGFGAGADKVRFTNDGLIAASWSGDTCTLTWSTGGSVTIEACADPLAVDPVTGTGFVSTAAGLQAVVPSGARVIGDAAELLAWDASVGALYTASGDTAAAVDADGAVLWSLSVGAPIVSIDDLGVLGTLAALTDRGNDGEIVLIDGLDGAHRGGLGTPNAHGSLVANRAGEHLAVVLDQGETHFFEIGRGRGVEVYTHNPNYTVFDD